MFFSSMQLFSMLLSRLVVLLVFVMGMKTRVSLISNLNHKTKKNKNTSCVK
jgi:hypothetical protein